MLYSLFLTVPLPALQGLSEIEEDVSLVDLAHVVSAQVL
jgi:hypothetical protein